MFFLLLRLVLLEEDDSLFGTLTKIEVNIFETECQKSIFIFFCCQFSLRLSKKVVAGFDLFMINHLLFEVLECQTQNVYRTHTPLLFLCKVTCMLLIKTAVR